MVPTPTTSDDLIYMPGSIDYSPFKMSGAAVAACVGLLACAMAALILGEGAIGLYLTFVGLSGAVYFFASPSIGGEWIEDMRNRVHQNNVPVLRALLFVRKTPDPVESPRVAGRNPVA
jgi:hypothetical protein